MPPERWLPVIGYEGYYEVSDFGRVRSLSRRVNRDRQRHSGRILKLYANRSKKCGEYYQARLSRDGVVRTCDVHVLVARAFLGPCPDGHQVCHGPAGSLDNSAENLSYGTPVKNAADRCRDGTEVLGTRNHNAKLTEEIVRACRVRAASGETCVALAREFGVSDVTMNLVVRGLRWRWVPGAVQLQRRPPGARRTR
jgi:hypothetical protein